MKVREGKAKVPILPRKVQMAFASVTGLAFVALLVFVLARPTNIEQTAATTPVDEPVKTEIVVPNDIKAGVTTDGLASETKNPEVDTPKAEAPAVIVEPAPDTGTEPIVVTPPVDEKAPAKEEAPKKDSNKAATSYTYVARSGDSYTVVARAAIANSSKAKGVTLSPAQRVAAETYLTQAAGAIELDIDQHVVLSGDSVKNAIEKAQSLGDDELADWDVFASQVDWDDDDTPEPVAEDGGASSAVDAGSAGDTGVSGGTSGSGGSPGGGATL